MFVSCSWGCRYFYCFHREKLCNETAMILWLYFLSTYIWAEKYKCLSGQLSGRLKVLGCIAPKVTSKCLLWKKKIQSQWEAGNNSFHRLSVYQFPVARSGQAVSQAVSHSVVPLWLPVCLICQPLSQSGGLSSVSHFASHSFIFSFLRLVSQSVSQ